MSLQSKIRFGFYRGSLKESEDPTDTFHEVWRKTSRERFLEDCNRYLDLALESFDLMLGLAVDIYGRVRDSRHRQRCLGDQELDKAPLREEIFGLLTTIEKWEPLEGRRETLADAARLMWGHLVVDPDAIIDARKQLSGWRDWDEETFLQQSLEWMPLFFRQYEHVRANLCRIANKIGDKEGYRWYRAYDVSDDMAYIVYSLPGE